MRDVSAFIGTWPFRPLPWTTPETLQPRLEREGITEAWLSPVEGLFAPDPQPVNAAWSARLKAFPFFRCVPVLNPTLPGWERSLAACRALENVTAARLHPNYHGYDPASSCACDLLRAAGECGLPVILQLRMQDIRSMHALARVPDTDFRAALRLAQSSPETPFLIASSRWGEAQAIRAAMENLPNLYLDISHIELIDCLRRFLNQWGTTRLLFGTHAPLFTPTAARIKMDAAHLSDAERNALAFKNTQQFAPRS